MLIILEGCDGAGKTTLSNRIAEQLESTKQPVQQLHMGPPEDGVEPFEQYMTALSDYVPRNSQHLIIDRLHLGEMVYGPIFRGKSKISDDLHEVLNMRITMLGGLIVYVDAPLGVLEARVGVRGDDFVKVRELARIRRAYRELVDTITDAYVLTVDSRSHNAAVQSVAFARVLERAA